MNHRQLGRTGIKISSLSLGCMNFGWKTDPAEAEKIVDHALESGINLFDTSNSYGKGVSEEILGRILKKNGRRAKLVLCTKVHNKMDPSDPNSGGNNRRHIILECEASLKRLQTDCIDIYQIHRPESSVPIDETLRALDDLIKAGKVHYIGSSVFASWQIVEAIWISRELGLNRFVCEQAPYSLLDRSIEKEVLPMATSYGLGVLTYSPLAEGLLTGKYRKETALPSDSRFAKATNQKMYQARLTDAVFSTVDKLSKVAEKKKCSLSELSIAWCLTQASLTSVLIGPSRQSQLVENLKALQITLDASELAQIDSIVAPKSNVTLYHDADFGPSQFR